jgi:hypothetical protein
MEVVEVPLPTVKLPVNPGHHGPHQPPLPWSPELRRATSTSYLATGVHGVFTTTCRLISSSQHFLHDLESLLFNKSRAS